MMAKMFYTMDEARTALGKNEEEIKQLAREGRLREFRDGPRLMFKADQVEQLKAEMTGGADRIDLGPSDSGAPIGLVDSKAASGTSVTLSDSDAGAPTGMQKEDTALAADLGLSGSVGGMPSPGRGSGTGLSGTAAGRSGINVFSPEEVEHADPSAQTAISSNVQDQVNLEGVGSGSGLLDLTRESDDTSLGAELLDEIAPGASGTARRPPPVSDSDVGTGVGMAAMGGRARGIAAPVYVEQADTLAPAFGGAAFAAVAILLFGAFVLTSAVVGHRPDIVGKLAKQNLWILWAMGLGAALVLFIIGLIIGKAGARR